MRTVTLNISKLGLVVGDVIKLQLVNSVGDFYIFSSGESVDITITLLSDVFELELLENKNINTLTSYRFTLPNDIKFHFKIPVSEQNTPHDLLSLLQLGCYKGIINIEKNNLDEKFIEKLNLYFTGENPHFSNTELSLVYLYEYYANEVIDTSSTIDIIKMMDTYLTTLNGEQ